MAWTTSGCEQGFMGSLDRHRGRFDVARSRVSTSISKLRTNQLAGIVNLLAYAGIALHWAAANGGGSAAFGSGPSIGLLIVAGVAASLALLPSETAAQERPDEIVAGVASPIIGPDPSEGRFVGLTADMSHQLRTPLNAIIGFSDMMQRELFGPLGTDRYRSYAAHIRESGFALAKAVDDTLALTRLVTENHCQRLQSVGLNTILDSAIDDVARNAEAKRVRLLRTTTGDVLAQAEPIALQHALTGLLQSAIAAAPRDSTVGVACRMMQKCVTVSVTTLETADAERAARGVIPHHTPPVRPALSRALIELQGGYVHETCEAGRITQYQISLQRP